MNLTRRLLGVSREEVRAKEKAFKKERLKKRPAKQEAEKDSP